MQFEFERVSRTGKIAVSKSVISNDPLNATANWLQIWQIQTIYNILYEPQLNTNLFSNSIHCKNTIFLALKTKRLLLINQLYLWPIPCAGNLCSNDCQQFDMKYNFIRLSLSEFYSLQIYHIFGSMIFRRRTLRRGTVRRKKNLTELNLISHNLN